MRHLKRFLPLAACVFAQAPLAQAPSAANASDTSWRMYNGNYHANRYSPLKEITPRNVGSLIEVGRYALPETTSFQTNPVVVDGRLFVTTATSTYALDATTGKSLWSHKYSPKSMGLGTPVHGVAAYAGRLYRGTPDAHLIALDAKTGKVMWDVSAFDSSKGEYLTVAPIIWENRLYIGNSGSDVGATGHVRAFDLKDGKRLWNFDVIPSAGPAVETWPADKAKVRAGGGMYSSFALDPEEGSLYVPTGNPGPDFSSEYRPGDNLHTCSVLKLDARTGALRAGYQFAKNDVHDWDVAASPVLLTSSAGKKLVAVGGKDGYLYALDRNLGKVLHQTKAGGPIGGGIVTYVVNGKQYVAVAAGMKGVILKTESGPATVVIYSLPARTASR